MKNLAKYFSVIAIAILWMSCNNDDDSTDIVLREYDEVYAEDNAEIVQFLKTHYLDTSDNNSIKEITNGEEAIYNMSNLESLAIERHDITYNVYYLNLSEGTNDSPSRVDSVYVTYKGRSLWYNEEGDIYNQTTFDERVTPIWLKLDETIAGWAAVFPKFKTGDSQVLSNGTIDFSNFGEGIMFLPSGLGYYNVTKTNIPAYTPLIFNFQLLKLRYRDHDLDKVLSKYELGSIEFVEPMDTDGDGTYDYLDTDDDADGLLTKNELTYDTDGEVIIPFDDCNGNGVPNYLDSAPCN